MIASTSKTKEGEHLCKSVQWCDNFQNLRKGWTPIMTYKNQWFAINWSNVKVYIPNESDEFIWWVSKCNFSTFEAIPNYKWCLKKCIWMSPTWNNSSGQYISAYNSPSKQCNKFHLSMVTNFLEIRGRRQIWELLFTQFPILFYLI